MRKSVVIVVFTLTLVLMSATSVSGTEKRSSKTVAQCDPLAESVILSIAEEYLGDNAHYMLAIAEIESKHGSNMGYHYVMKRANKAQRSALKKIASQLDRDPDTFKGSSAGAMGYMQVMPGTYLMYAEDGNYDGISDPMDPMDSVATASAYVADCLKETGNMEDTLFRYNRSRSYVRKVIKLASVYKDRFEIEQRELWFMLAFLDLHSF